MKFVQGFGGFAQHTHPNINHIDKSLSAMSSHIPVGKVNLNTHMQEQCRGTSPPSRVDQIILKIIKPWFKFCK